MVKLVVAKSAGGDWVGIYADGKMLIENHSVSAEDLLDALSESGLFDHLGVTTDTITVHDGVQLPDKLSNLNSNKDVEKEALASFNKVTLSGRPPEEIAGAAPAPIEPSTGQHKDYWVLPAEDRAKGFIRPVRTSYKHLTCGEKTTMGIAIAETYARNYKYYGRTFCATCQEHYPVGEDGEFVWDDGSKVGT